MTVTYVHLCNYSTLSECLIFYCISCIRFSKFERKNWRVSYNSLVVLEHLLTHGPESVSEEFQSDKDVIGEMESFQYIDEKGFVGIDSFRFHFKICFLQV